MLRIPIIAILFSLLIAPSVYADIDSDLIAATKRGDARSVHTLLDKGANANVRDIYGKTPLMWAAEKGELSIVRVLMNKGANINLKDKNGLTALAYAKAKGQIGITALLDKRKPGARKARRPRKPLAKKIQRKTTSLIEEALAHDKYIVWLLLIIPLYLFVRLISFLAKQRKKKRNKLFLNVAREGKYDTLRSLIENGANVNIRDKTGMTALMMAGEKGDIDGVTLLIGEGAHVNTKDKRGETALTHAEENNHPEIVKILLDSGADVKTKNDLGWSDLMHAAGGGHINTVRLLLEKGTDVNLKDKIWGQTALMLAAEKGYLDIVKELLAKGANVNIQTKKGKTALSFARKNDHTEIIELLKIYGARE
jgi:ankyrin repeat protein